MGSQQAPSEAEFRREIAEFRQRYPALANDELFVLWFLRAFVTEDETQAAAGICGGPGDKGVDAVLVDEQARLVFVVQGKYRQRVSHTSEHRGDVIGFAQLAKAIIGDGDGFAELSRGLAPEVQRRLDGARDRIRKRAYGLRLFYITLGKASPLLQDEARRTVRSSGADASFRLFDGKHLLVIFKDYLDGVAPPVPSLDLEIESGGEVRTSGMLNRYDNTTDIESWVFSMNGHALGTHFERAGTRLFARNVRGFLGNTQINRGMEETLSREPAYFWYYNNGVTIVCDDATLESSRGREVLRVTNPQVINGQQTTRTLSRSLRGKSPASVLVRVIRIPRSDLGMRRFDTLVSKVVSATNRQNAIRSSDLMSNDRKQIEIERQLRKLDYLYIRKRMTKGEARRGAGLRHLRPVKKEEFAQAVAGAGLDPSIVREGKERLFEERWYTQIFPTTDPEFYLSRYWLLRSVGYAARGYPERAYAKWLVMNFVWGRLEPLVRGRVRTQSFRKACADRDSSVHRTLDRAIDSAFTAALRFYRTKRGRGLKAQDVSSFFQHRRLHIEFKSFWRGRNNKSRESFDRAWRKFSNALAKEAGAATRP